MIGFLTGKYLEYKQKSIVMVGGVGYLLQIGSKHRQLLKPNQEVSLHIFTYVKEEKLELYAFPSQESQEIFQMLINVSGVGPKIALQIVDMGVNQFINAVRNAEVESIASIPRVGKKIAQKIIIELKNKLGELKPLSLQPLSDQDNDFVSALTNLGFSRQQAISQLTIVDLQKNTIENAIKQAIKNLSKK